MRAADETLTHVKANGEFYRLAAVRLKIAQALSRAFARFDPIQMVPGLAKSAMDEAARQHGLRFLREGFVEYTFVSDGMLRPRREVDEVR